MNKFPHPSLTPSAKNHNNNGFNFNYQTVSAHQNNHSLEIKGNNNTVSTNFSYKIKHDNSSHNGSFENFN